MEPILPSINHWLLIAAGAVLLVLEILSLKHWLKTLGLSLVLAGGMGVGFDIQDGLFQIIWFLVFWIALHRLGHKQRMRIRLADEHQEGGTGIICKNDGELCVVYKGRGWPIETDENSLKEGDHVVVVDIVNGRANVELLSRKSVHADD